MNVLIFNFFLIFNYLFNKFFEKNLVRKLQKLVNNKNIQNFKI